ncbi:MAG: YgfZ/GcvT domain-containing protein [Rudaea sp.]
MISLPKPQWLELTGTDAAAFAHAQFCNDVIGLADGHWQWNAWLSPQGRVRAFFHLLRDSHTRVRLLLRGGDAPALRAELARFVFRARVALRVQEDVTVAGSEDAAEVATRAGRLPQGFLLAQYGSIAALALPGMPPRWLLCSDTADFTGARSDNVDGLERWRLADIRAGLVTLDPVLSERLLPTWLNLDRLGAISVRKGCYPGQEIVARLYFKGGNKRTLYRVSLAGDAVPPAGTVLRAAATSDEAGVIVMAAADVESGCIEALASLNDAMVDTPLCLESHPERSIHVAQKFAAGE